MPSASSEYWKPCPCDKSQRLVVISIGNGSPAVWTAAAPMLSKSKASLVLPWLMQPSPLSVVGSEGDSQLQPLCCQEGCSITLPRVVSRVTTVAAGRGVLTLAVVLASLGPGAVIV